LLHGTSSLPHSLRPPMRRDPPVGRPALRSAVLFSAPALGIALQLIQKEDPTPTFRYFTIWCAAALCVFASGILAGVPRLNRCVGVSSSAGVVFSGLVYLAAIAPVNGLGSRVLTIAANLVLHVISPAAVVTFAARNLDWVTTMRERWIALALPGSYLFWAELGSWRGAAPVYTFLDIKRVGVTGVVGVAIGAGSLFLLISSLLSRLAMANGAATTRSAP